MQACILRMCVYKWFFIYALPPLAILGFITPFELFPFVASAVPTIGGLLVLSTVTAKHGFHC